MIQNEDGVNCIAFEKAVKLKYDSAGALKTVAVVNRVGKNKDFVHRMS